MKKHISFEGADLLIDEAGGAIERLKPLLQQFLDREDLGYVTRYFDAEKGRDILAYRVVAPVPAEIRIMTYRIVTDLRHSLDQAVFAAQNLIGGETRKDPYFPFRGNPRDLNRVMERVGFCEEVAGIIRDYQPYPAGDGYEGGNTIFRALGTIAGPTKHEVILGVGVGSNTIHFEKIFGRKGRFGLHSPFWDSAKNEVVLLSGEPGFEADYDIRLPLFVCFGEVKAMSGEPLITVMTEWYDTATRIIADLKRSALTH